MSDIDPTAQDDTSQGDTPDQSANLESNVLIAAVNTIPPDELSKILKVDSNMRKLGPLIAVVVAELSKIEGLREEINTLFKAKTEENKDLKTALEALQSNLIKIYNSKVNLKVIGTRHAEKLYETLLAREEVIVAEDLGNYYRVAADNRDLNYNKYFSEGSDKNIILDDYHSHNTVRLKENELIILLNKIGYK